MFEATVANDVQFTRSAVFARWRRQLGWWGAVAVIACLAMGISAVSRGFAGHWVTWSLLGLPALVMLFWLLAGWFYRSALREQEQHYLPSTLVQSRDDALVVRSGENVVAMPWARLKKIERRPDYWLLFWSTTGENFNVFPLATVPPEMQAHMLERAQAAGCKVK